VRVCADDSSLASDDDEASAVLFMASRAVAPNWEIFSLPTPKAFLTESLMEACPSFKLLLSPYASPPMPLLADLVCGNDDDDDGGASPLFFMAAERLPPSCESFWLPASRVRLTAGSSSARRQWRFSFNCQCVFTLGRHRESSIGNCGWFNKLFEWQ
jgi:hypothetical protein